MATSDNETLFADDGMQIRYDTVYEFLANDGHQCAIDKNYLIQVLEHIGSSLKANKTDEGMWKAYVLLDVLIDRWDECLLILKDEEQENVCDG